MFFEHSNLKNRSYFSELSSETDLDNPLLEIGLDNPIPSTDDPFQIDMKIKNISIVLEIAIAEIGRFF